MIVTAKNFFTEAEQQLLVEAIAKAESHTSGEIRLHLENFCFGDALKAAHRVFSRLGMQKTNERNGILIYIAVVSRKIAVVGDSGIHNKLGSEYWNSMVSALIKKFKAQQKAPALADAIVMCGEQLGKHFPRNTEDKNELSNTISY
jgi:uncharacterized membrane protein